MSEKRIIRSKVTSRGIIGLLLVIFVVAVLSATCQAQGSRSDNYGQIWRNWHELIHQVHLGNTDQATVIAQELMGLRPSPKVLFDLANSDDYAEKYEKLKAMPQDAIIAELILLVDSGRVVSLTEKNWDEMMHYAMIANFDLAKGYGEALLKLDPDPSQLLSLAESDRYGPPYRNLVLMQRNTPLRGVVNGILKLVENGRFLRRTEPERIHKEVEMLAGTTRERMLALKRLQDSGEWAVPIMIEVLCDPDRKDEYSVIRWAMPQLGQPAVNPLLVVLQRCRDLNVRLIVLDVLGKIGYRRSLAYIQQVIEDEKSTLELKNAALSAFDTIDSQDIAAGKSAAVLFENLADDLYNHLPSLAVPADQDYANIWFWDERKGLIMEQVLRGASDELMTMRCCELAINSDAGRADAISLWLSAFFRLEAEGYQQPGYFGPDHPDAGTYALTAGPEYLHRVLARALDNRNRPVALAAIETLQRNAGQQSLLYELGVRQPLIDAMSYPDREVRFSAALAVGGVMPNKNFEHSNLVVPTLAETLRQKGQRYALVVIPDQEKRNQLVGRLRDSGEFTDVIADEFLSVAVEQARLAPSLDLLVLANDIKHPTLEESLELLKKDHRLAFCPTIILSHLQGIPKLRNLLQDHPFMEVSLDNVSVEDMMIIAEKVLYRNQARAFAADLADGYAIRAAMILRQLALTDNNILPLKVAEPALIEAIRENRQEIQQAAIVTLARMDSLEAQRALANLALDETVDMPTRLLTFSNLAVSARKYGNLLLTEQIDAMYNRIINSLTVDSELRNLAAEAYGSLNLPSTKISELIIGQKSRNNTAN